ncbi:MAG: metal-sensitive transcriptional regulator [Bdellovibrionota bacterium]
MDKQLDNEKNCGTCEPGAATGSRKGRAPTHPDHTASLKRLNRIKGQLEAVARMIEGRKYCPDIIQQIRAADSALRGLEAEILRGHLRGCVKKAFESKNSFEVNDKIEEILHLWSK